ncbi:MAG: hypothetical protein GYB67_00195 [Chloroflexi bacterium]|nr:hypothetical protein [Chloroflexota bacterium]
MVNSYFNVNKRLHRSYDRMTARYQRQQRQRDRLPPQSRVYIDQQSWRATGTPEIERPRLTKAQRKALRFAYKLRRGDYRSLYLSYIYGGLNGQDGRHWIEPDRASRGRAYLNEATFAALEMDGYLESRLVYNRTIWLYRITQRGAKALGWEWSRAWELATNASPDQGA